MQNRVRAIIIKSNKLLTIKRVKEDETYWVLPGGGIEDGENHKQALIRECQEELGVDVEVGKFVFQNSYVHEKFGIQCEYFYECLIVGGKIGTGTGPEYQDNSNYEGTHELEWIDIWEVGSYDLRPEILKRTFDK